MNITIDGVEYFNSECHCKGAGHICYLRPVPNMVDIKVADLKTDSSWSANTESSRKLANKAHPRDTDKETVNEKNL